MKRNFVIDLIICMALGIGLGALIILTIQLQKYYLMAMTIFVTIAFVLHIVCEMPNINSKKDIDKK